MIDSLMAPEAARASAGSGEKGRVHVVVRAAAEGTVLLKANLPRAGVVPKVRQDLRDARPGGYAVDLILDDMLLEDTYEVQDERLELSATYRTVFALGDLFTGFECEIPWDEGDIPPGTTWVPVFNHNAYKERKRPWKLGYKLVTVPETTSDTAGE